MININDKSFSIYVTLQNFLNEFIHAYIYLRGTKYETLTNKTENQLFKIVDYLKIDKICEKLCSDYDGNLKIESYFTLLNYRYGNYALLYPFLITKFYFDDKFSFPIVLNLMDLKTDNSTISYIRDFQNNLTFDKINDYIQLLSESENFNSKHIENHNIFDSFTLLTPINPFFVFGKTILHDTVMRKHEENKVICKDIIKQRTNNDSDVSIVTTLKNTILEIHVYSPEQHIDFTLNYSLRLFRPILSDEYLDFIFNDDYDINKFLEKISGLNIVRRYMDKFKHKYKYEQCFEISNHFEKLRAGENIDQERIKNIIKVDSEKIAEYLKNMIQKNENLISELQEDPKFLKHATRLCVLNTESCKFERYMYKTICRELGIYDLFATKKNIENFITKLLFKHENIELNHKILFSNL